MFRNIGASEILIIVLVLTILFGSNKISQAAKSLGEAAKEFKKAQKEVENTKAELDKPILNKKNTLK